MWEERKENGRGREGDGEEWRRGEERRKKASKRTRRCWQEVTVKGITIDM